MKKNDYNPCIHRVYMAKLYWRVKKNGKWTWEPFTKDNSEASFKTSSGWMYSNVSCEDMGEEE